MLSAYSDMLSAERIHSPLRSIMFENLLPCTSHNMHYMRLRERQNVQWANEIALESIIQYSMDAMPSEEAIARMNRALAISENAKEACYGKALVYFDRNKHDLAMEWNDKALRIDPEHAPSLTLLEKIEQSAMNSERMRRQIENDEFLIPLDGHECFNSFDDVPRKRRSSHSSKRTKKNKY